MKPKILKKTARISLLALMLLGYLSETLPQLHHHEEQHACVEVDGLQRHQTETAMEHEFEGDRLVGVDHDEGHHHHLCALCQLVPSPLSVSYASTVYETEPAVRYPNPNLGRTQKLFKSHRSRAPPIFS